jgi:epoxyqueuosine reductase
MNKNEIALKIKNKAIELGFENCGIIRVNELKDYEEILNGRIAEFPASRPMMEPMKKFANLNTNYEWAKSVIVCTTRYGKYKVPEGLEGKIGKYYLFDHKLQPEAQMNKNIVLFENFLGSLGIKFTKELHGITSMRLAASKAGIGIIRKNNFLYTKSGSWVLLDTWAIDCDIEIREKSDLKPCPENCSKCIDSCPTKSLAKPNCTNMATCITRLTWGVKDLVPEELSSSMKTWIYGCDECQNACPINKDTWVNEEIYPGLRELSEEISLEKILSMDEKALKEYMFKKFWFIREENSWMWKVNVLTAMSNSNKKEYEKYYFNSLNDKDEKVREAAKRIISKFGYDLNRSPADIKEEKAC